MLRVIVFNLPSVLAVVITNRYIQIIFHCPYVLVFTFQETHLLEI